MGKSKRKANPIEYRQLTPEFIALMSQPFSGDRHRWPKCGDILRRQATALPRSQQIGSHIWTHSWKALHEGLPVRREVVDALRRYMNAHGMPELSIEGMSVVAQDAQEDDLDKDPWKLRWNGLGDYLDRIAHVPDEAYCQAIGDVEEAARISAAFVGRNFDPSVPFPSDADAIAKGLEVMRQPTWEGYLERLRGFQVKNPRTLLFAVAPDHTGAKKRIGMTFTTPLKEKTYFRLRDGKMHDRDITPDDYQCPSRWIVIHSLAETKQTVEFRHVRRKSLAQIQCIMFQLASFSPRLYFQKPDLPQFLAIRGSDVNGERARNYGFRPTGNVMPNTTIALVELAPSAILDYTIMWAVLRCFQARLGIVDE
jgi:hypothetical protein